MQHLLWWMILLHRDRRGVWQLDQRQHTFQYHYTIPHRERSNPMLLAVFSMTILRQVLMRLLKYPSFLIFLLISRSKLDQVPTIFRHKHSYLGPRFSAENDYSPWRRIEILEIIGGRNICKIITLYIGIEDFVAFHGNPFSLLSPFKLSGNIDGVYFNTLIILKTDSM